MEPGTREILFTGMPEDEAPRWTTLNGLTLYRSEDGKATSVRCGYKYGYRPPGGHTYEWWTGYSHKTTTFSMRTGTLRVYQVDGEGPHYQTTPSNGVGLWANSRRHPLEFPNNDLFQEISHKLFEALLAVAQTCEVAHIDMIAEQVKQDASVSTSPPFEALGRLANILAYPWQGELARAGHLQLSRIPTPSELFLRPTSGSIVELARAQFNQTATRPVIRAFAALLAKGEPDKLRWINLLRGVRSVVAPDVLADVLDRLAEAEMNSAAGIPPTLHSDLRRWLSTQLRHCSPARQRRLLSEMVDPPEGVTTRMVADTVSLGVRVADRAPRDMLADCRTLREAHDRYSELHMDVTREANLAQAGFKLEAFPDELKNLDGKQVAEDVCLVVPDRAGELVEWGSQLRHCIGSYQSRAALGRSWLFGLSRRGDVFATGEVAPGPSGKPEAHRLTQLYGSRNDRVDPELAEAVEDALRQAGVFDCDLPELDETYRQEATDVFAYRGTFMDVPF